MVDGTGAPRFAADVTVEGERIARVERVPAAASGLVLAPGFIDMHAHADLALLADPVQEAKVSQGVTTQVIGQDGIAYAPVDDAALALVRRQIGGWNGDLDDAAFDWRDVAGLLARLEATPLGVRAGTKAS